MNEAQPSEDNKVFKYGSHLLVLSDILVVVADVTI